MQLLVAVVMIVVLAGSGAWAEDHVVVKPGILCRSSSALSILTLPGGDSRTHRLPLRDGDLRIAGDGGCQDLRIGQSLNVVKLFRNTAIVTLDHKLQKGPPAFYLVPTIDLASESSPQPEILPGPKRRFEPDDPISEVVLTGFIGQDKDAFVEAHPEGECGNPEPDVERCVYHAVDREDCPVAFRCNDAIYEFHLGRMTSFQTGLSLEEDWKAAYRLVRQHYPIVNRARTTAGESIFFRTGLGILGFGRTFVRPDGIPPVWEIRFSLTGAGQAE